MALNNAISIVGGVTELANSIGVSSQVVTNWRARGRVPAEWCRAVEESTKGAVTRYDLRPDVFGSAPEKAA